MILESIKKIRKARKDSFDIFRSKGKELQCIIPKSGPYERFTLPEDCIRFLVLALIPPQGKMTVDMFLDVLYDRYGIVIGPVQYKRMNGADISLANSFNENVNSFQGLNHDGSICSFAELLYLVNEIDGIERIRFTTSNPIKFTQDIINAYRDLPKIVNSLHLPAQSGSDRILKLMGRPYTSDDYRDIIRRLRMVRPDISISSDFIVGFPSETREDFEETMRLIDDVRYDGSFSFIYSKRPGTPAAQIEDPITLEEKKERLSILQQKIDSLALQYSREMMGTVQRVVIDGKAQYGNLLCGRTENNRNVNFEGPDSLIGTLADVEITEVMPHSLKGKLVVNK